MLQKNQAQTAVDYDEPVKMLIERRWTWDEEQLVIDDFLSIKNTESSLVERGKLLITKGECSKQLFVQIDDFKSFDL